MGSQIIPRCLVSKRYICMVFTCSRAECSRDVVRICDSLRKNLKVTNKSMKRSHLIVQFGICASLGRSAVSAYLWEQSFLQGPQARDITSEFRSRAEPLHFIPEQNCDFMMLFLIAYCTQ